MDRRLLRHTALTVAILAILLTLWAAGHSGPFDSDVKRTVRAYLQARDEAISRANLEGLEAVADHAMLRGLRDLISGIRSRDDSVESQTGEPEITQIRSCKHELQGRGLCFVADTMFSRTERVLAAGALDQARSYANNRLRVEYVLLSDQDRVTRYKVVGARTITGPVYGSGLREHVPSSSPTPSSSTRIVVNWQDVRNRSGWGPSGVLSREGPEEYCKFAGELRRKTRTFRERDQFEPPADYERKRADYQMHARRELSQLTAALGARRFVVLDIPLKSDKFDAQNKEFRVYPATSDVWLTYRLGWEIASAPPWFKASSYEKLGFSLFIPMPDFAAARSFSEALPNYRAAVAFRFSDKEEGLCNLQMFVDGAAVYQVGSRQIMLHTGDAELLTIVTSSAK